MSGAFTQDVATRLWMPGTSAADHRIRAVARAVEEYDHAFRFARHELTGDWVVTVGDQGHPVFGFGRELPDPVDVPRLLAKHDIGRRGEEILNELGRAEDVQRARAAHAMSEANGIIAEQLEHAFRKEGRHPVPRVFIPRGI